MLYVLAIIVILSGFKEAWHLDRAELLKHLETSAAVASVRLRMPHLPRQGSGRSRSLEGQLRRSRTGRDSSERCPRLCEKSDAEGCRASTVSKQTALPVSKEYTQSYCILTLQCNRFQHG